MFSFVQRSSRLTALRSLHRSMARPSGAGGSYTMTAGGIQNPVRYEIQPQQIRQRRHVTSGANSGDVSMKDGTFEIKYNNQSPDPAHASRIWTSFDEMEKKHWLTVKHGRLYGRYMLQDNRMPAWSRAQSLPERIESAVNEMVEEIEAFERTQRRQGRMK